MTDRTRRLREESLSAEPSLSSERAMLLTSFYRENEGSHPIAILRALAFHYICEHKSIWIGDDELIVGERGPRPKAVPTYPELTCHSLEDLRIPPSNRLEKLAGDREGQHSIRINKQWRICFRWHNGDAYDVEIVDYH